MLILAHVPPVVLYGLWESLYALWEEIGALLKLSECAVNVYLYENQNGPVCHLHGCFWETSLVHTIFNMLANYGFSFLKVNGPFHALRVLASGAGTQIFVANRHLVGELGSLPLGIFICCPVYPASNWVPRATVFFLNVFTWCKIEPMTKSCHLNVRWVDSHCSLGLFQIVKVAKRLKKEKVNVDVVNFGEEVNCVDALVFLRFFFLIRKFRWKMKNALGEKEEATIRTRQH